MSPASGKSAIYLLQFTSPAHSGIPKKFKGGPSYTTPSRASGKCVYSGSGIGLGPGSLGPGSLGPGLGLGLGLGLGPGLGLGLGLGPGGGSHL